MKIKEFIKDIFCLLGYHHWHKPKGIRFCKNCGKREKVEKGGKIE